MFSQVTPAQMTGLRLWSSALLVAALGGRELARSLRDLVRERAWRDAAVAVAFGVTLGIMNYSIYQSFARIPLGIAVTIEFLGPLAVAVASSRRLIDLVWVGLAGAGVALLSSGWASLAPGRGGGDRPGGLAPSPGAMRPAGEVGRGEGAAVVWVVVAGGGAAGGAPAAGPGSRAEQAAALPPPPAP